MNVFPEQVLAFLGSAGAGEGEMASLQTHIEVAEQMVRAYTRGNGFDANGEPNDAIAAVVISCAARLHANPTMNRELTTGPFGVTPGTFHGWTLAELAVLHSYRVRAR